MATYTWIGYNGIFDPNDASQAVNWAPSGVPGDNDTIMLGAGAVLDVPGDSSLINLTISGFGTQTQLNPATLNFAGSLTIAGSITSTDTYTILNIAGPEVIADGTFIGSGVGSNLFLNFESSISIESSLLSSGIWAQDGAIVTVDTVNLSVTNSGDPALVAPGLVAWGGTLNVNAAVSGSGMGAGIADGGQVNFLSTFNLDAEFSGAGTLALSQTTGYGGTLYGFGTTDKIDLTGIHYDASGSAKLLANNVLEIKENGSTYHIELSTGDSFNGEFFHLSDDGQTGHGTAITVDTTPCYCRDTLILTENGEVPVQDLKIGDMLITADGRVVPASWLGYRTVSTLFADPLRVLPIRIKAGALGDNVPSRDFLLSPDHAILINDVLIQAGALVNGTSIFRETNVPQAFTYYHVELDDHSLILAENTPAETFIDNVDRLGFDNWKEHEALYPEGKAIVEMPYPRAKAHRQVPRAIREQLAERSAALCGAVSSAA